MLSVALGCFLNAEQQPKNAAKDLVAFDYYHAHLQFPPLFAARKGPFAPL